ncbi:MAG: universal stress protein [Lentisphaerae bacterium]|nr:universal stress protein [Lentisphaerota bacterium]
MIAMRTILCPVDFSDATARQAALAANLSRLFGARFVLHHNLAGLAPGAGVGWMWSADRPFTSKEAVQERLESLAHATAPGLDVAVSVTQGPAAMAVLGVCDSCNADLVVLSTHNAPIEEHTSLTEQVLERANRSVLALHDACIEPGALCFDLSSGHRQVTLVPTNLSPTAQDAVDFAFELARTLPLDLHLLHVMPRGHKAALQEHMADADRALRALIPADLTGSTQVHVCEGDPIDGITQAATDLHAACIVMGEHTRAPIRRWLSRDTSQGVLHKAPCPVWYVPGQRAA